MSDLDPMASIADLMVEYGAASEPLPPAAADLSTNTVSASAAVRNQNECTPPGAPSRSPSRAVPETSTTVVPAVEAGVKRSRAS